MKKRIGLHGSIVLLILLTLIPLSGSSAQSTPPVLINEIRIDQPGSDVDEYFELAGTAGASLDGLTYLVIGDGTTGSGTIEAVVDLTGLVLPSSGYFVVAESTFTLGTADLVTNLNFENSDNVTHLLVSGFTGLNGDDLDTNDDGTLDILPWETEIDRIALVEEENPPASTEFHYGPPSVGPDGPFVPGHVYRCPAGWQIGPFDPVGGADTPGAGNACVPEVLISEIRIDQPGSDVDEYFELAGDPGASLEGLTYLVIGDGTGGSGVIEAVVDLTGNAIPTSAFFVAAESTFSLGAADLTTSLNFENSDNVTHLLVWNFTGALADDLDTDDNGTLNVLPWTQVVDAVALIETPGSGDQVYSGITVGPDGTFVPGHVYRCPAGWQIGPFDPAGGADTPGTGNACVPEVLISEIRIDQPGSDVDEYFELAGDPGASLEGLTYLVIGDGTGGSGVVEAVVDLNGSAIPSGGFFVAAESTFSLGAADLTTSLNFENSDNVTHLLVWNFTGALADDLDPDDDGTLDILPWTQVLDAVALIETPGSGDQVYSGTTVGPDGTFVPGHVYRCPAGWQIGTFNPAGGADTPGAGNACVPEVLISEIRIDQPGSDVDEYFELAGDPDALLDGLTYLVIGDGAGGSGVVEAVVDLTGSAIPASGFFVAAESTFSLGAADLTTSLNFENSDNVTHLLVSGFTGSNGDDLDTDDDGVLDATPWGAELDRIALVEEENPPAGTEFHYGPPSVGPDGTFVPGHVYRCPNEWRIGAFNPAIGVDTPGTGNLCEACGDAYTPTYTIQGAGSTSPLDGSVLSVEGVVVGDFQGADELEGFFIQDPSGDGNPATSDGLFIYSPSSIDVSVGDLVRVRGEVDEFFGLTELTNVSNVFICDVGSISPTPVDLPVSIVDDLEAYEGMLVTFPEALSATDHYNQHRYGEVVLSADGRQWNPTDEFAPGPIAADGNSNSIADINEPGRLILDDGRTGSFPTTVPYIGADNTLRLGDTVTGLTGVLSYDFDFYRLHPTSPVTFTRTNPRSSNPEDVGGVIKVASFNTLNYWTTLDDGNNDARGADSLAEFERQQDKLVAAILGLDADIVGLQELENNGSTAIGALVAALNAAAPSGTWAYVPDPAYPGGLESTNAIKVGIIYRADRVTPVGAPAADDDPIFAEDRPPVAQTFDAQGDIFTVVVNHFKSKGCDEATGLDVDQGDGQGCYNYRRTVQAGALLDFVAALQAASGDEDVVVLGDFNAYEMEDPIAVLQAGLMHPLSSMLTDADRYSYVFFGQSGLLDYVFTSDSLYERVTGVDIWHINADEPRVLDYNDEIIDPAEFSGDFSHDYLYNPDAYRSSDHDPVLIGFNLLRPPVANADGPYTVDEGSSITLDGSASYDPDAGDVLTYAWDLDEDGDYDDASGVSPTFTGEDGPAVRTVGLKVTDQTGLSDETTAIVDIVNVPPGVDTGPDQTVYRFDTVLLSGSFTDPAMTLDEPYAWEWDLDGDAVADVSGTASYGDSLDASASFALPGLYTLTLNVTDKDGGAGSDTVTIEVLNRAPVCTGAEPSLDLLWPANHKFVAVEILGILDPEGDAFTITIDSIFQDEPVDDGGDGSTAPDAIIGEEGSFELRAERAGGSNGRVYHIAFTVTDAYGDSCQGEVLVGVPHDKGKKAEPPVDDGALYDSTLEPEVALPAQAPEEPQGKDKKK